MTREEAINYFKARLIAMYDESKLLKEQYEAFTLALFALKNVTEIRSCAECKHRKIFIDTSKIPPFRAGCKFMEYNNDEDFCSHWENIDN